MLHTVLVGHCSDVANTYVIFFLDGCQMDLPTVTCSSPSRILPSHEVVCPQVPQAGPGRRQLMTIVSSCCNVETLSRSDRNNDFPLYILLLWLSPIIPWVQSLLISSSAAKAFLQGSSYFQIFFAG